jgi:hypothetical protein
MKVGEEESGLQDMSPKTDTQSIRYMETLGKFMTAPFFESLQGKEDATKRSRSFFQQIFT